MGDRSDAPELSEAVAQATEAWRTGREALALEPLCAAWTERPIAALAELIAFVSRELVARAQRELRREHGEQDPLELSRVWLRRAQAGDRVAVHALLPDLIARRRGTAMNIAMLEPSDPVVLEATARCLLRRPGYHALQDYLERNLSHWLLGLHRWWFQDRPADYDRTAFAAMVQGRRYRLRRAYVRITWSPPASIAERDAIRALVERIDPERRRLHALAAKLDDTDARLVLGDYLVSQGDPRGEFIQLQLQRRHRRGSKRCAREAALLERHGYHWAGPLAQASTALRFEGGFVTGVAFSHELTRSTQLEALAGLDTLAAIEGVDAPSPGLLRGASLPSLRHLRGDEACARALPSLPALAGRLRSLGLYISPEGATGLHPLLRDAAAEQLRWSRLLELADLLPAHLPALEHFQVTSIHVRRLEDWRWLWTWGAELPALRSVGFDLQLPGDDDRSGALRAVLDEYLDQTIQRAVWICPGDLRYGLTRTGRGSAGGLSLVVRRAGYPWYRRLELGVLAAWVIAALEALPADLPLTIHVDPALLPGPEHPDWPRRTAVESRLRVETLATAPPQLELPPWP